MAKPATTLVKLHSRHHKQGTTPTAAPATTKITAKLYKPLLHGIALQLDELCIKRDAFLNKMISRELPNLASDMEGKKNSSRAKRFIAGELKRLDVQTVNIVVDKSVADGLNEIVERHNIVRDAFINRLILFLRSNNGLLELLELPKMIVRSEFDALYEEMPTSPLKALEAVFADPLYYVRMAAEERLKQGIYAIDLPPKLYGFSCHLDDGFVPKTEGYAKAQQAAKQFLEELESFEADAYASPRTDRSKI